MTIINLFISGSDDLPESLLNLGETLQSIQKGQETIMATLNEVKANEAALLAKVDEATTYIAGIVAAKADLQQHFDDGQALIATLQAKLDAQTPITQEDIDALNQGFVDATAKLSAIEEPPASVAPTPEQVATATADLAAPEGADTGTTAT